jgi:hypothetical protein
VPGQHAIHGTVADDIVRQPAGIMNQDDHPEWGAAQVVPFKSNNYKEHLATLFACREPEVHKVLLGANVPDIDAVSVFAGTPVDGVVLWDHEDMLNQQFPIEKFQHGVNRDDKVASVLESSAAQIGLPVRGQYLIIDHSLSQYATDADGNEYDIGVMPSVSGIPNLCQLYVAEPGDHDKARVPYLNNGVPINVVFTWPVATNYAYSNICFEQDYFWSGQEVDVNAHDANLQKPTRAQPADFKNVEKGSVWPPTFAMYGGLVEHTPGRN